MSLVLIRRQRRRPDPSGTQPGDFREEGTAENTSVGEGVCGCCTQVTIPTKRQ